MTSGLETEQVLCYSSQAHMRQLALTLHSSNESRELSQCLWSWRQHHKQLHCYYYYYY